VREKIKKLIDTGVRGRSSRDLEIRFWTVSPPVKEDGILDVFEGLILVNQLEPKI
jgi:hypothetical protein